MFSRQWAVVLAAGAMALYGQESALDPHSSIKINLPPDSPVSLLSADMGESRAVARGSATVIDLHMALRLRNSGPRRISGVTLLVSAQEVTPGGRGSVSKPSLHVGPGETFPVRIDLRLLRPAQMSAGPLVQVSLDGVLFDDLSFYGPNRLDSRRTMTAWELEAQRDRRFLKSVLASQGGEGLRREMIDSLARQAARPRLDVRVTRGAAVASAAVSGERPVQFAFVNFPDSPVQPMEGWARIAGSEARAPRIQVRNRSPKPVRYVEIGWIVKDRDGREFLAAALPAADPQLFLPSGRTAELLQDTALKFSRAGGEPVPIAGMTGFVSQVEFADGSVWVPDRESLGNPRLQRVVAPSPEEQRLSDLYRTKGLQSLVEELRKF